MKTTLKSPADLVNDITLKKIILAGIALFVLNFLIGLATAKAQAPQEIEELHQEISSSR